MIFEYGRESEAKRTFYKNLGQYVRDERERKKYTRESLSEISGVEKRTLQNIEMATHMPSIWTLCKVFNALGLEDFNFYVIQNYRDED